MPTTLGSFASCEDAVCGEAISGTIAVAIGSGDVLVAANPYSGLRMPAIGVSVTNATSGGTVQFVRQGRVYPQLSGGVEVSGSISSGFNGKYLYVCSGGLLGNLSGFCGAGAGGNASGAIVQRMGVRVSGGVYVDPGDAFLGTALQAVQTSGLVAGVAWVF